MNTRARHSEKRKMRLWLLRAGAALLITLLATISYLRFFKHPLFSGPSLTELVIPGPLEHVQPQAVRAAVLPALLGKGFFSINVEQIKAAVQAVPWVATAAVRRSWPHTLYIDITEEVPVARWNGSGLMDAQGRVFVHSIEDGAWAKLPMLSGPEGSEQDVLAEFNNLTTTLTTRGLAIQQLTVDARGDSTVVLDDSISVRLGRADAESRLERFTTVALPVLTEKLADVAYVDMRYTNGFAVGWTRTGISPACQRHAGPGERPATEGRAGGRTRDGSQNACTTPTVGQSNEVGPNG
ncbi:MAG TPA: cell division protein FtsQ/DivIB [Gammaproteobacteria bacterium]|nr:cell division protein FtsQ/DivIB [Gammaproteobacteria bacterium]